MTVPCLGCFFFVSFWYLSHPRGGGDWIIMDSCALFGPHGDRANSAVLLVHAPFIRLLHPLSRWAVAMSCCDSLVLDIGELAQSSKWFSTST